MADDTVEARRKMLLAAMATCEREARRTGEMPQRLGCRIAALRRMMAVGRLPRIAVVGRRGAGKSSLANALLGTPALPVGDVADRTGAPVWRTLVLGARRVDWLDTPGLRAAARRASRRGEVDLALIASPPDLVLALCQAAEVDAGVDDDLGDIVSLLQAMRAESDAQPLVIGVVTKVDELAPPDAAAPFADTEKQSNIATAVAVFGRHLERAGIHAEAVLPVATYMTWAGEMPTHDARWNVDALVQAVVRRLPADTALRGDALRAELARMLKALGAEVTEVWADTAWASGHGVDDGELAALEDSLATILSALVGTVKVGTGASPREILQAARASAPSGILRTGLQRLGARRASAWVASARLRTLGTALLKLEDTGIDLDTAQALVPGAVSA